MPNLIQIKMKNEGIKTGKKGNYTFMASGKYLLPCRSMLPMQGSL